MSELTPSEIARALGSIKTPRKAESSRANAAKATAAAQASRTLKACTCNSEPHKRGCAVYNRQRTAESRARKRRDTDIQSLAS